MAVTDRLRGAQRALARVGVGAVGLVVASAWSSIGFAAEPATEGGAQPEASAAECPPGAFCESADASPGKEKEAGATGDANASGTTAGSGAPPVDGAAAAAASETKQQSDATEAPQTSTEAKVSASDDGSVTVVLPPTSSERPRVLVVKRRPGGGPPEVVAYDANATVQQPDMSRVRESRERDRHWGLQLRGTGLVVPRYRTDVDSPAMGGGGVSLRYRPIAPLAIDAGMDVLMGYDSNGYQRTEVPLALSMMLYMLPHSVVQPYAFVGLNTAFARVDSQTYQWNLARGTSDRYTYVGGHAGLGLELRLAPVVSLSLDGLAFVRDRVDDTARRYPEFYDRKTGETSNTSVGGQVRGGLTFWW